MKDNRDFLRQFEIQNFVPIFEKSWWLDAVAHESWNASVCQQGNNIVGILPYDNQKKWIFNLITNPPLTPYSGPLIALPDDLKPSRQLSQEHRIIQSLIGDLPSYDLFRQSFNKKFKNWLQFYWSGFNSTVRITYELPMINSMETLFAGFNSNVKRNIKKARKNIIVSETNDVSEAYRLIELTFQRQNKSLHFTQQQFESLDDACAKRNARLILIAKDEKGQSHAMIYLVWDEKYMYYFKGGSDPDLRDSGANVLLFYEAFNFCMTKGLIFDFEGSMLQPVEQFITSFGAVQKPYLHIWRANSRIAKIALKFRNG